MKKISSDFTWVHKRLVPVFWFGGFGSLLLVMSVSGLLQEDWPPDGQSSDSLEGLVFPMVMLAGGYVGFRLFVWDLMDEVYDDTDSLLLRNAGEYDRVSLSDVLDVTFVSSWRPRRIALRLARPSRFGSVVSFRPALGFTLKPFARNRIAEDLLSRVAAELARHRAESSADSEGGRP